MKECNDIELAGRVRELQTCASDLDRVMRDGTLHSVIALAARLEDAARKLGWRALELEGK